MFAVTFLSNMIKQIIYRWQHIKWLLCNIAEHTAIASGCYFVIKNNHEKILFISVAIAGLGVAGLFLFFKEPVFKATNGYLVNLDKKGVIIEAMILLLILQIITCQRQ